jgi:hypothetical protein
LAEGGPVSGIQYFWTPFESEPPELFVKVTNNTDRTVLLSEAVCKVISSVIQSDQIIVFHEVLNNVNHLQIENFGWGSVTNPILKFRIQPLRTEDEEDNDEEEVYGNAPGWYTETTEKIELDSFDEAINVDLTKYLPLRREGDGYWATVVGTLSYGTDTTSSHTIMFHAHVVLAVRHGKPKPPSWEYDLFLTAGRSNYEEILDISQELKKGEADNFLIRVHSDKSAVFDTQFSFRSTSGQELPGNHIKLFIFEPRLRSFARPSGKYFPEVRIAEMLKRQMGSVVVALKHDPKDFSRLYVYVSEGYDDLPDERLERLDALIAAAAHKVLRFPKPAYLTYVNKNGSWIRTSTEGP